MIQHSFPTRRSSDLSVGWAVRWPDAEPDAIMGLADEWEEVLNDEQQFGYHYSSECGHICYLAREAEDGAEFRLFRRRG